MSACTPEISFWDFFYSLKCIEKTYEPKHHVHQITYSMFTHCPLNQTTTTVHHHSLRLFHLKTTTAKTGQAKTHARNFPYFHATSSSPPPA
jgi:hypothetical protein